MSKETGTEDGAEESIGAPNVNDVIEAFQKEGRPEYKQIRDRYIANFGSILEEYYSESTPTGIILLKNPKRWWNRTTYKIALNYRANNAPAEVDDLIRTARLEERLWRTIVSGRSQLLVVRSIYSVIVSLLHFVDSLGDHPRPGKRTEQAVESTGKELNKVMKFAREIATKATLHSYVAGIPFGIALVAVLVQLLYKYANPTTTALVTPDFLFCTAAGTVGAVVSVMMRLTDGGKLSIDSNQSRLITTLVGAFRPVIGAVLGAALYVLIRGEILPLAPTSTDAPAFFYASIGFIAGFSERWAQDIIVQSSSRLASTAKGRETEDTDRASEDSDDVRPPFSTKSGLPHSRVATTLDGEPNEGPTRKSWLFGKK